MPSVPFLSFSLSLVRHYGRRLWATSICQAQYSVPVKCVTCTVSAKSTTMHNVIMYVDALQLALFMSDPT